MDSPSPPDDLVLSITLLRGEEDKRPLQPSIWRKFRCSGGINLDVFQDKILQPIMGWARNYHTYYFAQEGIYYFQDQTTAVDAMQVHVLGNRMQGGRKVNPCEFTVGDLFHEEGDSAFYAYDLGDHWYHKISCLQVVQHSSENEFFGEARVLDGEMRCPPEDGEGGRHYQEAILDRWNKVNSNRKWTEELRSIAGELASACYEETKSLNVRESWRPHDFTILKQQKALCAALQTRDSVRMGNKQFKSAGIFSRAEMDVARIPPGQRKSTIKLEMPDGTFWDLIEIVNVKPDYKPLCGACGNPHNIKTCGRCHMIAYCCHVCQKKDWTRHKKECKSLKAKYETYNKEKIGEASVPQDYVAFGESLFTRYDPDNLRFQVGDEVECRISETDYAKGKVIKHFYSDSGRMTDDVAPYQIQLLPEECRRLRSSSDLIFAMWDDDYLIRKPIE